MGDHMAVVENGLGGDKHPRGRTADITRDVADAMGSARETTSPENHLLPRARGVASQAGMVLGLVGAATLGRLALGLITPGIAPFSLYFPAILLAALVGGWRAGTAATVLAVALTGFFFTAPARLLPTHLAAFINIVIYAVAAVAVVILGNTVKTLLERVSRSETALAESNLHYEILFQTMSEGFALCEGIRDDQGHLSDYFILEMNPALQRMLGVGPEVIGGKLTDKTPNQTAWLKLCDRALKTGTPQVFEYHNPSTKLWHEIHITRVSQNRMAQLFFDITERKAAQAKQAELFDELNHRVKNNLAIVSAMLDIQARKGEPTARSELLKAVDRVQSIADVHAILYRGHHSESVDFGAYLEGLCDRLSQSLLVDDRIRIEIASQSALVPSDHAVPLGMIVNELVTNAVKYAYPPPDGGVVSVRFGAGEKGLCLSVGDSGRGLPADLEGNIAGLGVRLIRSLVKQVGGEFTIRDHQGLTFEITLPKSDLRADDAFDADAQASSRTHAVGA